MDFCDWRDGSSYEYTEEHTRELWAWEFLRRNEDYVKDWNVTLEKFVQDRSRPSELRKRLDDFISGKAKTFCRQHILRIIFNRQKSELANI
jgi:hypothetical protein